MENIKSLASSELEKMITEIQKELEYRQNKRFDELVDNFMEAYHALRKEFPWADVSTGVMCEECGVSVEVCISEILDEVSKEDFTF